MLRILTYHRVGDARDAPHLDPRLISASPDVFERQMRHLVRKYRVVGMDQVLDSLDRGVDLPRRAVLITFDDAYRDFSTQAWPILKRYELPATLFVPTAYPDCPERKFWWDRLHHAVSSTRLDRLTATFLDRPLSLRTALDRQTSLRELHRRIKVAPHVEAMDWVEEVCSSLVRPNGSDNYVLGWDELRRLAEEGVTLGAHTRTHPLLDRLAPHAVRAEIVGSREDLARETGADWPIVSYPDGIHDAVAIRVARETGFRLGFSTRHGINDLGSADRLRLRRTNIGRRTKPWAFRARMLPWFARVDAWRHRAEEARR